jgi:hypothetical protein
MRNQQAIEGVGDRRTLSINGANQLRGIYVFFQVESSRTFEGELCKECCVLQNIPAEASSGVPLGQRRHPEPFTNLTQLLGARLCFAVVEKHR